MVNRGNLRSRVRRLSDLQARAGAEDPYPEWWRLWEIAHPEEGRELVGLVHRYLRSLASDYDGPDTPEEVGRVFLAREDELKRWAYSEMHASGEG